MNASETHPRRVDLERFSTDELSPDERSVVNLHLESCAECQSYLDELALEQRTLLAQQPASAFADRLLERNPPRTRNLWLPLGWVASGGIAVAAIALLFIWWPGQELPSADEQWQLRGKVVARAVLRRNGQVRDLLPSEPLRVGDSLRIEVTAPGPKPVFAALIALPGGERSVFALSPRGPEAFLIRGQAVLPGSAEVSDDPEPVRLVLIVREHAFELSAALREIEALDGAKSPATFDAKLIPGAVWTRLVAPGAP